jgi:hypothetical protein
MTKSELIQKLAEYHYDQKWPGGLYNVPKPEQEHWRKKAEKELEFLGELGLGIAETIVDKYGIVFTKREFIPLRELK